MEERTTKKRRAMPWVSLVLGMLLAVIILLYLFLRTDFFAAAAGRLATRHLLAGTPFTVAIDNIEGSIVRDLTVRNPRVLYRNGEAPAFELFRADELTCRFSIGSLFGSRRRVDEVIIVNPVIRLVPDSTGAYLLPSFGSGGFSTYAIGRFSVHDGRIAVRRGEGTTVVNDVNLDGSIASGSDGVRIGFSRGSASDPSRRFFLRNLAGGIGYTRAPSAPRSAEDFRTRILFDSLAVSLDRSALVLDGSLVLGERLFDLAVRAGPIDIDEMARLVGRTSAGGGQIEGAFVLRGVPSRMRVEGAANGILLGYALNDFVFSVLRERESVEIDSIGGFVNGARLSGRGKAVIEGRRSITLAADVEHIDLAKGFLPEVELPATDMSGAVDITCRFDPLAASFALDLEKGHFRGVPFEEAWIRGSYRADTLRFRNIALTHPEHRVSASGTVVGGDAVSFIMNVDIEASSPIFSYFDVEEYRADALLNGRWEGTFDEYDLRMSGECRNFRYHAASLPEGTMKLAIEKNAQYGVFFDLEGRRFGIGPAEFDSLSLSLEYAGETTRIKRLSLANADFAAAIQAEIGSDADVTAIRLGDCEIEALGERWVGGGSRTIFISKDAVRFDDVQFHSRDGAVYADGIWRTDAETLDGALRVERFALGTLSRAGIAPLPLEGRAWGTVSCAGALSDPDLLVALAIEDGRIDTFGVKTVRIAAAYAAGRCRIDSLAISSPSGELFLGGEISGLFVRDVSKRPREALRSAVVAIEATCRDLKAAPLLSLARVRGFTAGRLDGTISVRDSLVHPLVVFRGTVRGLARTSITVPEVDCELRLNRRSLEASGVIVLSEKHRGSFRGSVPVSPAAFLYSPDAERPVSLEVDIPEGDFAGVTSLTDRIAEAAGRYAMRISVTGTIADPHLDGGIQIRDASLRIAGLEERYSGLNASVQIEDSLITLSRLAAREGNKGSVNAGGTITLRGWKPAQYDLAVRLNDFSVESLADMVAVITGDLRVITVAEDGRILPKIIGTCTVDRSEIYYDIAGASTGETGPMLVSPSWIAAVDLKIPGNTWIRTDDARIELQGDVTLHRDHNGTYFRGDISLVRGWYNVYNNKFRIRSGTLRFIHAGSARPVIDIEAETKDPEGRRIYLTIQWHQDDQEPRLTLAHEDAGYSETEIWLMLGGGVVGANGAAGATWDARGTAQNLAANYLERMLNAQMQGLTIELESPAGSSGDAGTSDWTNTKIAVGRYLSEGLYVKYKQGLSISTAREIEVEYRLSNMLLLRSQVIRYSEQALPGKSSNVSDEINVDVKLRWEY